MQILHSDKKKELFKVAIQGLNDLWVLYNIIQNGDIVGARTLRRVILRDGDPGERKPMFLELKVEGVEFHEYSNRLRIKGKILKGPDDFVSIGQYHTINAEKGTKLTIVKEKWFRQEIRRLEDAKESSENILLAIAIESGLATIGLISDYSLSIISTIRHNIPGKRYSKQNHSAEVKVFLNSVLKVTTENVDKYDISLAVICGPGFLKEQFQEFLKSHFKDAKKNLNIRTSTASSGTKSAIIEIIKKGVISDISANHRLSLETAYVENFVERLGKDNGLYTYGFEETISAAEMGAIEDLLVTDTVMRSLSSNVKKKIETLFNNVEKGRGRIHIISKMHPA
jgi:protein pelota